MGFKPMMPIRKYFQAYKISESLQSQGFNDLYHNIFYSL